MRNDSTIFGQILQLISDYEILRLVSKYNTDRYCKSFKTDNLLTCLLFAQAKGRDSLRAIETGLLAHESNHYHLGLPKNGVKRSTLADANNRIDYHVFEELFYALLKKYSTGIFARKFDVHKTVYAIDATFVDVIIDMFPWAKYRATKGAIKMHAVVNVNQQIPTLVNITEGDIHDLDGKPYLSKEVFSDSIVTFDKGYWKASWLSQLDSNNIYFVTRIKENVNYKVTGQHEIELGTGVLKDEIIKFASEQLQRDYPKELRLVTYYDSENERTYRFVTNLFNAKAKSIADIYKYRWQIELFFKWIKQNLIIKSFLGCSKNAVFNQIWVALIYYLLVSYIHSLSKSRFTKLALTRLLEELLFERISLLDLVGAKFKSANQLKPKNTDQLFLRSG